MRLRPFINAIIALGTGAALVLTLACSDDDSSETGSIRETRFNASDYAYNMPASIEGGLVKLTMTNSGQEPHQANLFRLNDGVSEQQLQNALTESEEAVLAIGTFRGGPNTNAPGATDSVYTELDAGKYAFLCFVTSADGLPHIAKGMVDVFDVEAPGDTTAEAPKPEETYQLADFAVLGPDTLPAGTTLAAVTNNGPSLHELSVIKLEGITFDEAKRVVEGTAVEPPQGGGSVQVTDMGGLGAMEKGRTGWTELTLDEGTYAFLCFIPDPATGRDHASLGMMKEVRVD